MQLKSAMVKVNHQSRQNAFRDDVGQKLLGVLLLLAGLVVLISKSTRDDSSSAASSPESLQQHVAQVDHDVIEGSVKADTGNRNMEEVAYLHCGPRHTPSYGKKNGHAELLLLHGARFTKEEWKTSGIMKDLCKDGTKRPGMSVTALDLSVTANGTALLNVFDALVRDKILSGDPIVVVTPSASGKAMLTLAEVYDVKSKARSIDDMVALWVPVACGGISRVDEEAILAFANVPVLAIYGSEDPVTGGQTSDRLVDLVGATKVELKGSHPVYLDSPKDFVEVLVDHIVKLAQSK